MHLEPGQPRPSAKGEELKSNGHSGPGRLNDDDDESDNEQLRAQVLLNTRSDRERPAGEPKEISCQILPRRRGSLVKELMPNEMKENI